MRRSASNWRRRRTPKAFFPPPVAKTRPSGAFWFREAKHGSGSYRPLVGRSTPCVDAFARRPCTPQAVFCLVSTSARIRPALMPGAWRLVPRFARSPRMAWIYADCYVAAQYSGSPSVTTLQPAKGPILPRGPAAAVGHWLPPPWARPDPQWPAPERCHAQSSDETLFPAVVRAVRRPGRRALSQRTDPQRRTYQRSVPTTPINEPGSAGRWPAPPHT